MVSAASKIRRIAMKRLATKLYTIITVSALVLSGHSADAATPAVGAGTAFSAVLKADGTVWTWGNNNAGQFGKKTTVQSSLSPVQATISDVTAISVGDSHVLAIKSDKSVWAWGRGDSGQLGNNKISNSSIPVQATGLTDVIAVRAGTYNSVALKSDGSVWTWGLNDSGQLGNGTLVNSKIPVQVSGLADVTAIAVGNHHMLALKADGSVWAWGLNNYGQLGNGTYTLSSIPVQVQISNPGGPVSYLAGVTSISCGSLFSLALIGSNGSVRAWGWGLSGQLGNGESRTYGYIYPETVITSISTVTAAPVVTAAPSPAPTDTTTTTTTSTTSTPTEIIKTVTAVTVSPTETSTVVTTTTMPILTNVAAVSAGGSHAMARMTDGSLRAWGFNSGRLGNSTPSESNTNDSSLPVSVSTAAVGVPSIVDVSAGADHTLALSSDNKVWAWGGNTVGQLGNGSTIEYSFPVTVTGYDGNDFLIATVTTTTPAPTTPTPTTPTTPTTPGTQASCQPPSETDADRIFNWAESKYPTYFSPPATSQDGSGYRYRYYSGTNAYLGYKEGTIFHYDAAKWNAIVSLGRSCLFLEQAKAAGF